jgi:hypothetical protein
MATRGAAWLVLAIVGSLVAGCAGLTVPSSDPTVGPVVASPVVAPSVTVSAQPSVNQTGEPGSDADAAPSAVTKLEAYEATVRADASWFDSIGAYLVDVGPALGGAERILVDYLAPSDAVGATIALHFGDPAWLELRRDGPMLWTGPRGVLIVKVLDRNGRPVVGVTCETVPLDATVEAETGLAFSTNAHGVWKNAYLPATKYVVRVVPWGFHTKVLGTAKATVPPNGTTRITVVVDP